jgi:hypothetical protein
VGPFFFKRIAAFLSTNRHLHEAGSFFMTSRKRQKLMSSLDLELDTQMNNLETEWRQVYEAGVIARADYQSLAANSAAKADLLDRARDRLDRAEALKARIMAKIERLEDSIIDRD